MTPLALVITNGGMAAFARAQLGEDIDLAIATVALTDQPFVVAPTLDRLPGEFRRLATVSGRTVGLDVVHMVVRDADPVSYTVRGLGLFLADGTLFAVYGQSDVLVEKASRSAILLALDLRFPREIAATIVFGDTNFLNPPATETTAGVLRLATEAEALAGEIDEAAITPKGLARRIVAALVDYLPRAARGAANGVAALDGMGKVPAAQLPVQAVISVNAETGEVTLAASDVGAPPVSRQVTGVGLAKGGGSLEEDREIRVEAATAAEIRAGIVTDKAVTPAALAEASASYADTGEYRVPGGPLKKEGIQTGSYGEGQVAVNFLTPFPTACRNVQLLAINASGNALRDIFMHIMSWSKTGFIAYVEKAGSDGATIDGFHWEASGL